MDWRFLLLVLFASGVGIGLTYLTQRRSESIIDRWAESYGYRVIRKEWRWFRRGPYFWRASKNQTVYRVEILDGYGYSHVCWVRCGSWLFGVLSDEIDVEWES